MKKLIKRVLPEAILGKLKYLNFKYFFHKYGFRSFSETGEDVLLYKLFHPKKSENVPVKFKKDGLYIDIGCNHPVVNSQTFMLYKQGWKGIVIDPLPDFKEIYTKLRPRDVYLPCGVSDKEGHLEYYMYDLNVINSFNGEASRLLAEQLNAKLKEIRKVEISTLTKICSAHIPKGETIDFMSIDVEGYEMAILKSNDWDIYRAKFILVEVHNWDFNNINKSEVYNFLISCNYKLINVIGHNCLFEDTLNPAYSHF